MNKIPDTLAPSLRIALEAQEIAASVVQPVPDQLGGELLDDALANEGEPLESAPLRAEHVPLGVKRLEHLALSMSEQTAFRFVSALVAAGQRQVMEVLVTALKSALEPLPYTPLSAATRNGPIRQGLFRHRD